jgi:hypothetical protein
MKKVRNWIALLLLPSLIAGALIYNIIQHHTQLPMLEDENIVTFSDTCISVDEWRKHAPTSTGHSVHWFNYITYYRISLAGGAVYDSKGERFSVTGIDELEKCEGQTVTVQYLNTVMKKMTWYIACICVTAIGVSVILIKAIRQFLKTPSRVKKKASFSEYT